MGGIYDICWAGGQKPWDSLEQDAAQPGWLEFLGRIHPLLSQTLPGSNWLRLQGEEPGRYVLRGGLGAAAGAIAARPPWGRTYPFWFTPGRRPAVLISQTCLARMGPAFWREVPECLGRDKKRLGLLLQRPLDLAGEHEAADREAAQ